MNLRHPRSTLFPYTTLFRSNREIDPDPLAKVSCDVSRLGARAVIDSDVLAPPIPAPVQGIKMEVAAVGRRDRKSTRLNSSHVATSYAVFSSKKNMQVASLGA